jgi:hypothetical protein
MIKPIGVSEEEQHFILRKSQTKELFHIGYIGCNCAAYSVWLCCGCTGPAHDNMCSTEHGHAGRYD